MKKKLILGSIVILLGIAICFFNIYYFSNKNRTIIIELTGNDVIELLDKHQKSIIVLGFPECPWCEQSAPILNKTIKKHNLEYYYINTRNSENKNVMQRIENDIHSFLKENNLIDEFLVPSVILLDNNGKIVDIHVGTIKDHNAIENKLTPSQEENLYQIYDSLCIEFKGI